MNLLKQYVPKDGYTVLVKPGKDGIDFLETGVLRLGPGATYRSASEGNEVCLVFLGGLANLTVGEEEFISIGSRATVFAGRATAAHIPPGYKFKLEAIGALEVFVARSPSDLPGEPRVIGPEKVKVSTRGTESSERIIHDIIDPTFPSKRLLVGETFSKDGCWSSYPPHKHDTQNPPDETRMEEVYFFKIQPAQGFAFQRVYSPERKFDQTFIIRDNSCVKLPFGYHPVAVAPGYSLYYLWILAGEPRAYTLHDDPDHKWVKEA
jgi:5-deoxy-glucuronate isomerase